LTIHESVRRLNPFLIQVFLNHPYPLGATPSLTILSLNPFLIQVFLNEVRARLEFENTLEGLNPFLIQVFLNPI